MLLLDVAARRVSIEPSRIRAAVGRAMGRRGEVKEDTVAAWKRARSKVDERTRVEPAAREVRSVRFEADEESSAQAIDVGAEKPTERADGPAPVRRIAEPEAADDDDGDYTSRLLAAKRRARGGDESEGDSRGS